jgi:hypothetical protein
MRSLSTLSVLLIGLLLFTPFECARTYESWTDGIYDPDFDGNVHGLVSLQIVLNSDVLNSSGHVDVVVATVSPGNDRAADLSGPSPRSARAPPTA